MTDQLSERLDLPQRLLQGLTLRTIAFVENYVASAGRNAEAAAVKAGFAPSGAQAHASRLLRDDRVLALIRYIVERKFRAEVVAALEVIKMIRDDPTTPPATKLKAAESFLDRGGMLLQHVSTVHHVVEDRRSSAGDLRQLVDDVLMLDVGLTVTDPGKLERALAAAAARDQSPRVIDITPDLEEPEVEQEKPAKNFAVSRHIEAETPVSSADPALSDEALARLL
ncbi:MAG TPA: terminase small subunit [Xanthobacteraceae bacterium]|nr:terminase small subunit [Xanthobacteraceae bacterium]